MLFEFQNPESSFWALPPESLVVSSMQHKKVEVILIHETNEGLALQILLYNIRSVHSYKGRNVGRESLVNESEFILVQTKHAGMAIFPMNNYEVLVIYFICLI